MDIEASILAEIQAALASACALPDDDIGPGPRHAARSRSFIHALAGRLRVAYQADRKVAVLSRCFSGNRERFGLNELLFDILVCQTAEVHAAASAKSLTVVRRGILAVESEFAHDSRQALHDFNKLVLSAADYKLFIGPRVSNEQAFLVTLAKAASYCSGRVIVVLVPHPADWTSAAAPSAIGYCWDVDHWTELDCHNQMGA